MENLDPDEQIKKQNKNKQQLYLQYNLARLCSELYEIIQ